MSDLADMTKREVKAQAEAAGISTAHKSKAELISELATSLAADAPESPAPANRKGIERYTVLTVRGMCAVEDGVLGRIHDGWWSDGDKGLVIATARCQKANQNDIYTGLSDEQRAKNTAAGLEQFVVR